MPARGPVSWSAAADATWLGVALAAGTLAPGQIVIVALAPSIEGLREGEHIAGVTISAPGATGSPQVVERDGPHGQAAAPRELVIADLATGYHALGDTSSP